MSGNFGQLLVQMHFQKTQRSKMIQHWQAIDQVFVTLPPGDSKQLQQIEESTKPSLVVHRTLVCYWSPKLKGCWGKLLTPQYPPHTNHATCTKQLHIQLFFIFSVSLNYNIIQGNLANKYSTEYLTPPQKNITKQYAQLWPALVFKLPNKL